MMRKLPSFSESIFRIMMSFLLDIEVRHTTLLYGRLDTRGCNDQSEEKASP